MKSRALQDSGGELYQGLVRASLDGVAIRQTGTVFGCALVAMLALVAGAQRAPQIRTQAAGTLIAVNQGDRDISLIDPIRGLETVRVPEGATTGHEVETSPDGKLAFVPIYGNSTPGRPGTDGDEVTVIDIASRRVVHRIRFSHGVRPHGIVLNPHDGLLYVTTELDRSVSIIDTRTFRIVGSIPTGAPESHMLALSPDGRFGYTANITPGSISVLDLHSRKLVGVIPIATTIQRISVSADGAEVFTADQDQPRMAVIDVVRRKIKAWVQLPSVGYGSASTLTGKWLVVTLPQASLLTVIDTSSLLPSRTIAVPAEPHEVLMTPDGRAAYIACTAAQVVARVDLESWRVTQTVRVGKLSDGIGWANDGLSSHAPQSSAVLPR